MVLSSAQRKSTPIHRSLLGALIKEGLDKTAATLREEAGLGDIAGDKPDEALQALLKPGIIRPEAAAALQAGLSGDYANLPLAKKEDDKILKNAVATMADQDNNLDRVSQMIKALRMHALFKGDGYAEPEQTVADLEAELAAQEAEAENLRIIVHKKRETRADMDRRLKHAKVEMEVLRAMRKLEVPNQACGDAEKIRKILGTWDLPHGLRRKASNCFAHTDTNHDGRLQWNNDEIRSFVRAIFRQYQVAIPQWADAVWYELYRRCDVDSSCSLDLEESFRFARVCFETALHSIDSGLVSRAPALTPSTMMSTPAVMMTPYATPGGSLLAPSGPPRTIGGNARRTEPAAIRVQMPQAIAEHHSIATPH